MSLLETAETRWGSAISNSLSSQIPASLWIAVLNPPPAGYLKPQGTTANPALLVHANHGSWQTLCPFCPSAQHAAETDPWFYCADCQNEAVNHQLIPVVWPLNQAEIEAALMLRPDPETRNWEPGETITALHLQDLAALEEKGAT